MEGLPTEVMETILGYLSMPELATFAQVSRRCKQVAYDPALYTHLTLSPYSTDPTRDDPMRDEVVLHLLKDRSREELRRLDLSHCTHVTDAVMYYLIDQAKAGLLPRFTGLLIQGSWSISVSALTEFLLVIGEQLTELDIGSLPAWSVNEQYYTLPELAPKSPVDLVRPRLAKPPLHPWVTVGAFVPELLPPVPPRPSSATDAFSAWKRDRNWRGEWGPLLSTRPDYTAFSVSDLFSRAPWHENPVRTTASAKPMTLVAVLARFLRQLTPNLRYLGLGDTRLVSIAQVFMTSEMVEELDEHNAKLQVQSSLAHDLYAFDDHKTDGYSTADLVKASLDSARSMTDSTNYWVPDDDLAERDFLYTSHFPSHGSQIRAYSKTPVLAGNPSKVAHGRDSGGMLEGVNGSVHRTVAVPPKRTRFVDDLSGRWEQSLNLRPPRGGDGQPDENDFDFGDSDEEQEWLGDGSDADGSADGDGGSEHRAEALPPSVLGGHLEEARRRIAARDAEWEARPWGRLEVVDLRGGNCGSYGYLVYLARAYPRLKSVFLDELICPAVLQPFVNIPGTRFLRLSTPGLVTDSSGRYRFEPSVATRWFTECTPDEYSRLILTAVAPASDADSSRRAIAKEVACATPAPSFRRSWVRQATNAGWDRQQILSNQYASGKLLRAGRQDISLLNVLTLTNYVFPIEASGTGSHVYAVDVVSSKMFLTMIKHLKANGIVLWPGAGVARVDSEWDQYHGYLCFLSELTDRRFSSLIPTAGSSGLFEALESLLGGYNNVLADGVTLLCREDLLCVSLVLRTLYTLIDSLDRKEVKGLDRTKISASLEMLVGRLESSKAAEKEAYAAEMEAREKDEWAVLWDMINCWPNAFSNIAGPDYDMGGVPWPAVRGALMKSRKKAARTLGWAVHGVNLAPVVEPMHKLHWGSVGGGTEPDRRGPYPSPGSIAASKAVARVAFSEWYDAHGPLGGPIVCFDQFADVPDWRRGNFKDNNWGHVRRFWRNSFLGFSLERLPQELCEMFSDLERLRLENLDGVKVLNLLDQDSSDLAGSAFGIAGEVNTIGGDESFEELWWENLQAVRRGEAPTDPRKRLDIKAQAAALRRRDMLAEVKERGLINRLVLRKVHGRLRANKECCPGHSLYLDLNDVAGSFKGFISPGRVKRIVTDVYLKKGWLRRADVQKGGSGMISFGFGARRSRGFTPLDEVSYGIVSGDLPWEVPYHLLGKRLVDLPSAEDLARSNHVDAMGVNCAPFVVASALIDNALLPKISTSLTVERLAHLGETAPPPVKNPPIRDIGDVEQDYATFASVIGRRPPLPGQMIRAPGAIGGSVVKGLGFLPDSRKKANEVYHGVSDGTPGPIRPLQEKHWGGKEGAPVNIVDTSRGWRAVDVVRAVVPEYASKPEYEVQQALADSDLISDSVLESYGATRDDSPYPVLPGLDLLRADPEPELCMTYIEFFDKHREALDKAGTSVNYRCQAENGGGGFLGWEWDRERVLPAGPKRSYPRVGNPFG